MKGSLNGSLSFMSWHMIGADCGFDKGGLLRLMHTAGPVDPQAHSNFSESQLGLGAMQRGFGVLHSTGFFTGKTQKWGLEAARLRIHCAALPPAQKDQLVWKDSDFMPNQADPAPDMDPNANLPLAGVASPLDGEASFKRLLWVDFNGADGTSSAGRWRPTVLL